MANRIKSISKYNGTAWGTETPIGADAANVDLATSYSATTATDANNATVETAMAAIQTDTTNLKKAGHGNGTVTNYDSTSGETSKVLTTDCVVAASDDTATAWSKFNRFRRRVSNKFADYFQTANLVTSSTGITTTGSDTTAYTTKAINDYLANVVGYTNSTEPDDGTIAEQLSSLNDNMVIDDTCTATITFTQNISYTDVYDSLGTTWRGQCSINNSSTYIHIGVLDQNSTSVISIQDSNGCEWGYIGGPDWEGYKNAKGTYPTTVTIKYTKKRSLTEKVEELQFSYANNKLQFGKLIMFFDGYTTTGTTSSYHFPSGTFPTACLAVIPYASHTGFGAASTISVWGITKDGFQYYSFTNPAANLGTKFVAIGY